MGTIALCRNADDTGWLLFEDCLEVLRAHQPGDVPDLLDRVEQLSERGLCAVGYLAYEAAAGLDAALSVKAQDGPLACFAVFEAWREIAELADCPELEAWPAEESAIRLGTRYGKPGFLSALASIEALLSAGDTYQVNLTEPLLGHYAGSPLKLFQRLYAAQPSALSTLLLCEDFSVLSVSPELFFSVSGRDVCMQPMKGTRPRGHTAAQDKTYREELLNSEKERAENLMIVDMVRNDLGRIAESASVKARPLFELIELPTVWQMVSTVRAKTDATLRQVFTALFPCASITGAPKARAMEIIGELERDPRGVYTGAIGRVMPDREWQFSVAIRTLCLHRQAQSARYGVGAGIVWGHDPEAEWRELLAKAEVLQKPEPDFCLFETLRYEPHRGCVNQALHLERLRTSAAHFGFCFSAEQAVSLLDRFDAAESVRLRLRLEYREGLVLEVFPLPPPRDRVRLQLSSRPVYSGDPFLRHKTSNRCVYDNQRRQHPQGDDVLLWNERGELTESTVFNLLAEIDGQVLTPALEAGLLPGIQRQLLLESGEVQEAVLLKTDLQHASQLWVCNSLRGRIPAEIIA